MTRWHFRVRDGIGQSVDVSPVCPIRLRSMSVGDVESIQLIVGNGRAQLGEVFRVQSQAADEESIVIEGASESLDHLGASMTGGQIWVRGDVGHHLGSPSGASRLGMSGGRIVVLGSAKDFVGHRMRRGEIWVEGTVGRFAGAHMVAGTLVVGTLVAGTLVAGTLVAGTLVAGTLVAGTLVAGGMETGDSKTSTTGDGGSSPYLAAGMRRGSILVPRLPDLPDGRFSKPVRAAYPLASVMSVPRQPGNRVAALPKIEELLAQLREGHVNLRRGDVAAGGQGEVIAPV